MAIDDNKIVQLYFDRDENAVNATAEKYGNYCNSIAINILGNKEDAEECVSDTYFKTWNSIPPNRPSVLKSFLGKITRNDCAGCNNTSDNHKYCKLWGLSRFDFDCWRN